MAESEEELKSLLMKMKEDSENTGLNLNIQKTKIMVEQKKTMHDKECLFRIGVAPRPQIRNEQRSQLNIVPYKLLQMLWTCAGLSGAYISQQWQ